MSTATATTTKLYREKTKWCYCFNFFHNDIAATFPTNNPIFGRPKKIHVLENFDFIFSNGEARVTHNIS